jgi:hypothetical protein
MRDLMVKSVKKLPPVQEQGPAPVKVVPQYVVDLLACDPQGDRPPSLELEVASYRTLYWGMENGLLDKPVGLHMYELCRTGGTDRVLVDLKRRLAEPLQDSERYHLPRVPRNLRCAKWSPDGVGILYTQSAFREVTMDGRHGWLMDSMAGMSTQDLANKVGPLMGDHAALMAAADSSEDTRALLIYNMATNMARLEKLMDDKTRDLHSTIGAAMYWFMLRDLEELSRDSRSLWLKVKRARCAMLSTSGVVLSDGKFASERVTNRAKQLELLDNHDGLLLEQESQLGKLIEVELQWSRGSSYSELKSPVATAINKLFISTHGAGALKLDKEYQPVDGILGKLCSSTSRYKWEDPCAVLSMFRQDVFGAFRRPRGPEVGPRKAIRTMSSTVLTAAFLSRHTDLHAGMLPDSCYLALLKRRPDIMQEISGDERKRLATKFLKHSRKLFPDVRLGKEHYVKYLALAKPKKVAQVLSSFSRYEGASRKSPLPYRAKVDIKTKLVDYSPQDSASSEVLEWLERGAPGLPERFSVTVLGISEGHLLVSVRTDDWSDVGLATHLIDSVCTSIDACQKAATIKYFLRTYTEAGGSRSNGMAPLDTVLRFLTDHSRALSGIMGVHPLWLSPKYQSEADIDWADESCKKAVGNSSIFDFSMKHTIRGNSMVYWESPSALKAALDFLHAVRKGAAADVGDYVLPSTFLRRSGLLTRDTLPFRSGLAKPVGAEDAPSMEGLGVLALPRGDTRTVVEVDSFLEGH